MLAHEPRHLRSWLTFNVRQNMHLVILAKTAQEYRRGIWTPEEFVLRAFEYTQGIGADDAELPIQGDGSSEGSFSEPVFAAARHADLPDSLPEVLIEPLRLQLLQPTPRFHRSNSRLRE